MTDAAVQFGSDDVAWADRCNYWLKKTAPKSREFVARAGVRQPLILTGHGVRLQVDHGALLVQDGFTHYPQQRETWRFFPGDWRLPSRIVVVDVDGGLSFAALGWLSEHNIPLIQINWRGEIINVVSGNQKIVIPEKLNSQLKAQNQNGGLNFALKLIRAKIANSIETLRNAFPKSGHVDLAITKLETLIRLLKSDPPSNVSQLMGIEGRVGYAYFNAWYNYPMRWKELIEIQFRMIGVKLGGARQNWAALHTQTDLRRIRSMPCSIMPMASWKAKSACRW